MENILTGILTSAVTAGVVIIIAGVGEILAERTGVINLGIEGMMSLGAVTGIIVVNSMGASAWQGLLGATLVGLITGIVFSFTVVTIKANQLLTGLALTLIGNGLARHIGKSFAGQPAADRFAQVKIPLLGDLPILGDFLFNHNVVVYLAYFVLPVVAFYLIYKTRHGLEMRAVGQMPAAADASGVRVDRLRFLYSCVAGALAGAAGAYLSLGLVTTWFDGVVAGKGWITITLVFFSGWNPIYLVLASLLFGGATSIGYVLQIQGVGISPFFLNMSPYVATILMLIAAWLIRRQKQADKLSFGPAALGTPYYRE